ncbi:uncharacterized protein LOC116024426 [Ipomoea triloba]|uniref:uncharacterized protein LOC116024426 n=1 Tax=Ipomoea triloba TaxID=35885 RepID=UPI00125DCA5A|nr:uncharacterized protein LOC116024426 [Ipomoea triloba]
MGRKRGANWTRKRKRKMKVEEIKEKEKGEEKAELSAEGSPSIDEEEMQVEMELRLLEALEIYPPAKLKGIHRHFVLYGLTQHMQRSLKKQITPDDVLKLLDRFYNLEMLEPDDDELDILNKEEEFSLPPSFFPKNR